MTRKVYVNGDAVEVGKDKITAGELIEMTGRKADDYKLELRDGPHGPLLREFAGGDTIDLDGDSGGGEAPGGGPAGGGPTHTATGAGADQGEAPGGGPAGGGPGHTTLGAGADQGEAPGGGPAGGGPTHTAADSAPCYFVTSFTGPINPA